MSEACEGVLAFEMAMNEVKGSAGGRVEGGSRKAGVRYASWFSPRFGFRFAFGCRSIWLKFRVWVGKCAEWDVPGFFTFLKFGSSFE